jgi:integrase
MIAKTNRLKLTKTYVDRISPGPKDEFHWDTEVKGFGLRVTPRGKITFVVQGRVGGCETPVRITVGAYGVFTVDQARDDAREHLRSMRRGIDPRDAKKADDAMRVTLQQVCDAYVSRPGKLKPSSKAAIERHVRTTFEAWKDRPIIGITEDDCRKRYREMLTKGLRGNGPAPGQANQGFSVLGALINYAGRQYRRGDGSPLIARNPVTGLKDDRVRLKPRTSRILDGKVGVCWLVLDQWRGAAHNRDTLSSIDLVRFLILTGLRISEASALTWDRVNLEDAWFHLPNPKNGHAVTMPLSSQALDLLKARPRTPGSPFVFSSWGVAGHIKDPRDTMVKLSGVAGSKITPHDLRRTFTNIALRVCRIEKFRTDLLTNHITRDVTAEHYFDTTNLQWLEPEAQKIGDWIEQQSRVASAENVVRLCA